MATKKPNSKLAAVRKKKAKPKTTVQADLIANIKDQHLDSVPEKVKSGELDPESFDVRDLETLRPRAAETERIAETIEALLDKYYSRDGKYSWKCGFFLEGDPATAGAGGWKVLQVHMIGPHWTNEFKSTVGLHESNGAVCWAGRGRMERHVICVITTKLRNQKRALNTKHTMEQFEQIDVPAGSPGLEVTEKQISGPLVPDYGSPLDDTGTEESSVES